MLYLREVSRYPLNRSKTKARPTTYKFAKSVEALVVVFVSWKNCQGL